ncbi:AAA family ATPase [Candidatus Micrarchaeota archaeon]|nr:AAA family ATPase [Candidatus Micrarchaeota archaeon]
MENSREFIGLTGTLGSGKGTVLEIIKKQFGENVVSYGTGDFVREEVTRRGLTQDRPNQQKVANEMRATRGTGVLAEKALEKAALLPPSIKLVLVDGIRNPGEVQVLRNAIGKNFVLWAIDAPIEVRYERIRKRAREGEHLLSFEEFKASEEKEKKASDAAAQSIPACMALADGLIENNGPLEELEKKVKALLKS